MSEQGRVHRQQSHTIVSFLLGGLLVVLGNFSPTLVLAQEKPPAEKTVPAGSPHDYNGMYSFLREGEFVQVTVEDGGRVTGFVSRYGDLESDKGAFLDQFFKTAKLDGEKLAFTTEVVHGTMFDFVGAIGRGAGKSQQEEAYYVIQGKLIETSTDRDGKAVSKERQVVFKSFPRSASSPPPPRQ